MRVRRSAASSNLEVLTCDVNQLSFPAGTEFDRVVSVEMFEHMRNYETAAAAHRRLAQTPRGTLFVHIFTHKTHAYPFEVRDESDWMAKAFLHRRHHAQR